MVSWRKKRFSIRQINVQSNWSPAAIGGGGDRRSRLVKNFHNVDILPQLHEAIQLMFGSISNHKLYTVDIQFKSELILRYQLKKDKKIENIIRKIEQPKL
ncbi:putative palmitoyltransferase PFA3 [Trichinella spiralis]|uniref:putative palmitoyltransferase PFA3 n=1 Tax=Trichinella spiralis TaxID=6334 RepID=UPI0001EFB58B|nr:putative palmitoyltransferase PFA3 [Trichinella spiralis]